MVVYVSEDQVFSEPILKDFERAKGITVKSVFDTEEAKSTGVMNRLIAEKDNPRKGRWRSKMVFINPKIAVLPSMPSASASTATPVKTGC